MKTEDNDILKQFMDASRQEIPDNGFSRRVMRSLPRSHNRAAQLLNAIAVVASVFLFFIFDGLQAVVELLRNLFVYAVQHFQFINIDLKTFIVLFCVASFFTIRMAWQHVDD